ncbi:uncharacterized protein LOC114251281 [Bombyx mandarina]|uniref:Uncharacterized protein LOC114251281 n=1 Tax=Bombyx mandarina TaxID=7092 RepID=A0A6J2KMC8_BOMMA|nr:uncharacterized protein LOC114251281 [Bombyx mandarina]
MIAIIYCTLSMIGYSFQHSTSKLDQAKFAPRIDYFTLPPRCGLKKGFAMTLKMIMFLSATKILTVLTRQADRGKVSGETGGPPRRIPARCKLSLVKFFKDISLERLRIDAGNVDWSSVYNCNDIDSKVSAFNNLLLDLYNNHAPLKRISFNCNSIYGD